MRPKPVSFDLKKRGKEAVYELPLLNPVLRQTSPPVGTLNKVVSFFDAHVVAPAAVTGAVEMSRALF